jgi:glycosyltransferase involved in cell wall biosynthesis
MFRAANMVTIDESVPLTIAIPTYNRCDIVRSLVQSVCEHALPSDEIIVSDDGSTDGTVDELRHVQKLRLIGHEKNRGMVANWNTCLESATNEWVCIVHDDDRLEPGALSTLRRACALANGPALILHRYAGRLFNDAFQYTFSEPSAGAVLSCPTIPSGAIIHRAIIDQLGLFDPHYQYSADLEYFPRIAARFPMIIIESPRILEYRLHGTNYQFKTWHQADFFIQYEALQRSVISHAGVQDEALKREILEQRTIGDLLYMFDMADRLGDRSLVRQVGKYCQEFRHRLSIRQRFLTQIGAITGWRPRRHKAKCLESL